MVLGSRGNRLTVPSPLPLPPAPPPLSLQVSCRLHPQTASKPPRLVVTRTAPAAGDSLSLATLVGETCLRASGFRREAASRLLVLPCDTQGWEGAAGAHTAVAPVSSRGEDSGVRCDVVSAASASLAGGSSFGSDSSSSLSALAVDSASFRSSDSGAPSDVVPATPSSLSALAADSVFRSSDSGAPSDFVPATPSSLSAGHLQGWDKAAAAPTAAALSAPLATTSSSSSVSSVADSAGPLGAGVASGGDTGPVHVGSGSASRRALQFSDEYEYNLFTRSVDAAVRQSAAQTGHRSLEDNMVSPEGGVSGRAGTLLTASPATPTSEQPTTPCLPASTTTSRRVLFPPPPRPLLPPHPPPLARVCARRARWIGCWTARWSEVS